MTRQIHCAVLANPIDVREAEISKLTESQEDLTALRQHLQEIIRSKQFKGSHRSGQFLQYIVEEAIAGRFSSLKERVIGVEVFGRSPSYDTGEDAIVRVTAGDVRKRLHKFYDICSETGRSPRFHLTLPLGSYIPEFTGPRHANINTRPTVVHSESIPAGQHSASGGVQRRLVIRRDSESQLERCHEVRPSTNQTSGLWMVFAALFVILNLLVYGLIRTHPAKSETGAVNVPPWSVLTGSSHVTHLITSDPNIVFVQTTTGSEISVSDYANRKYIPDSNTLTPERLRLVRTFLGADNSAAAIDPPIALRIAAVFRGSTRIEARAARSIQLSDLKSDDNFIFLGSPRSNPWTALFNSQLDFRFVFDKGTGQEVIQDVHPQIGELPTYIPTAHGWTTGRSYAIIAFIQNPDQNGRVLLIAGANGEGTEAAGKLATDLPRLSAALNRCGTRESKLKSFELLLGLNTLAGSSNDVGILACHLL